MCGIQSGRGYCSWCCYLLRAWRPGDRIPAGTKFSAPVQTGPGAHSPSCAMGTGSFPGVKRLGRSFDHLPLSSAEVKGRVELYLCRSQWPRTLRRRSAAARLLRLWVRIPPGAWMFDVSVVCCQVEVSVTGWSLVQRSPTDCGASLCVI